MAPSPYACRASDRGRDHLGVGGQAEVVVAGQVDHRVAGRARRSCAGQPGLGPRAGLALQRLLPARHRILALASTGNHPPLRPPGKLSLRRPTSPDRAAERLVGYGHARDPRPGPCPGARRRCRPRRGGHARGAAAARRGPARAAAARPRRTDEVVRPGGRGRGHRLAQDRRLPRGLPLLLAVGPVHLAGAVRLAGHPVAGRGGQADRGDRRDRVLHRRRRPRARPAADGADARGRQGDQGGGRHPGRGQPRHAHPGAGRRAGRDGRAPLQPQPRDLPSPSSPTWSPPTRGRSAGAR